jgi:hypothetical protein
MRQAAIRVVLVVVAAAIPILALVALGVMVVTLTQAE